MFLARNIRGITGVVRNVAAMNGGCVVPSRMAGFKSDLKIRWVRPENIKSFRPEKSGDGGLDLNVKPQDYCNFFDKSKELEDADEIVKKMFTLEFSPRKEIQNKTREKTLALVKRHEADRGSMESVLAAMTAEILDMQEYVERNRKSKPAKKFLKELIDKRKKYLGKLRRWDYKRFEWVLNKMNLVYKPHPPKYEKITRKKSMRMLTQMHCAKLRKAKLQAYRDELAMQRQSFYVAKVEKLEFIRSEEIACGKEPTVTEEEILAAKKMAEEYSKPKDT